jgi:thioredoxin 1
VRGIPTVVIIKNGEIVDRKVGVEPKENYETAINALLS